jgi:hypothetical protein
MFEIKLSDNAIKRNNELYTDDLRRLKKHITEVPTFVPKKFIDQIQFFDDGTDQILYLYSNNNWRSDALS